MSGAGRRRLREATGGDSLELLLDTICNVFGGIILLAILVVLQTQVTAEAVGDLSAPDPRLRRAEFEAERAARERAALLAELEELTRRQPEVEQLARISARRASFVEAIEAAQAQLERERGRAEELKARRQEAEKALTAAEDRLRRVGEEAEEARVRAGAVPEAFRKDVRLPMWHDQVAPIQRSILIEGEYAFALPEDCSSTPVSGGGTRYAPIIGRGRPVPDDAASREAVTSLLTGRTPRGTYVSFWVCDSSASFEAFQRLRAAVLGMNYEYTVSAFEQSKKLILFPGRPRAE